MGSGVFGVGVSALQVAQLGLATTSHNISNANTEGYSRQRILQAANIATLTGAGYVGQGAHVTSIERVYSSFLSNQVNSAQSTVSKLDAYASAIGNLDSLLSDSDAALSNALSGFFTGVDAVSANPSSTTARQTMVSAAETLVARFQTIDSKLDAQYESINSQVQSYVGSINSYADQIAKLNQQIISAQAANNQQPNDLYDQRDQLIAEVNKLIGVKTTTNTNGSYNVYFGNGQQLVVGTQATKLTAVTSSTDPSRLTVGVVTASGALELPESVVTGGALGGTLLYRSETLDDAANELGRIAVSLAYTFNAQHALGQDLLGNISGDAGFVSNFFNIGSPTVIANTSNPTGSAQVSASFSNASYGADGAFYTDLTGSDYRLDYNGTALTLTRLSDNVTWTGANVAALNAAVAASTQGPQGFTIAATGTFAAGSSYLIQPTRYTAQSIDVNDAISSDVRYIAAAAPIRTEAGTSNTGTATISAGSVATGYTAPAAGSPVTLTYSSAGGGFTGFSSYPVTVTANGVTTSYASGTVPYTSGATMTFGGMSFEIGGAVQNGDTFTISKNTNGTKDNRNALLLSKLQTGKTMAGNTASYATVFAQVVSSVGNKANEVDTILTAQTTLLKDAQNSRNSVSAVNLDEEAVNLLQYQQAYQAGAKILQIASQLFDSILEIA
ncbi:flagellar hook-associated protein FlgK [Propionivibrio soli]|uniref:flagellar hook-associated protein FlgK n=1 Tax=Propionivibrio soli TaxID=2976531 RepID=UPI0021E6F5EE|nr:flagellar hook-associated protein FlgK [Propionivibrio soli]